MPPGWGAGEDADASQTSSSPGGGAITGRVGASHGASSAESSGRASGPLPGQYNPVAGAPTGQRLIPTTRPSGVGMHTLS